MIATGFTWVILATFFRTMIDPWFNTYPLISTLVLSIVLLTYATSLILSGSVIGKPILAKKKQKGVISPPLHYVLQWALIGAITIAIGVFIDQINPIMSWLLWLTGGVILLSQFLFLLIPSTFQQESSSGEIVTVPNRLLLKEKAYNFWDTSILAGGFFMIIGALLKSFSDVGGLLSIGTGLSWMLGAISFAVVSSFHLGSVSGQGKTASVSLIPEENFSFFQGSIPIKHALMEAYSNHINTLTLFRATKNGILFWGPSEKGRKTFARTLAGETGRAYIELRLSDLKDLSTQTLSIESKKLVYKIHLHRPVVLYIVDYQEALATMGGGIERDAIKRYLLRLLSLKNALVVMGATDIQGIQQEFRSPPFVHWMIELSLLDIKTRVGLLHLDLIKQSRKNEVLPGNIPILSQEMIEGLDLFKLADMMEGFSLEDIEDILQKSIKNARDLKRPLRQLDIDVSIRRKTQGWHDPTLEPMDSIRNRMTDEAIRPALLFKAADRILKQKRRFGEALLIVGKEYALRKMIAQQLADREKYHFSSINPKEFARDNLGAFRNFILQNKRTRPVVLFVDPLEILFPRVQLSHFSYHGEIYNQKVIELSQSLQERQFWVVCGTSSINEVDPMILRKFSRVIEVGELQRELHQEVEGYAMEKLLEGSSPDAIDFSRFHLFGSPKTSTPESDILSESSHSKAQANGFHLNLLEMPPPAISGFFGRDSLQNSILNTIETARLNIRTGGSSVLGAFMFLGPTQSGKRTLSEHLSQQVFQKNDSFVYRDMGLFDEIYFAEQFLNKPTDAPRTNPSLPEGLWDVFSVDSKRLVYLDHVERAHPSLWPSILPILRDGKISWKSKTIPISQSIFVLSSTLFSPHDFVESEPWERPDAVIASVQNSNRRLAFLPLFQLPFLKQLDLILPFSDYSPEEIQQVATQASNQLLKDFARNIDREGSLTVDPELYLAIAEKLEVPHHGMSRLDKTLTNLFVPVLKQVREKLEEPGENYDFVLYWSGSGVSMNAQARAEAREEVVPAP
ncbi:MAG: AAA family ATPase [Leptospirales bacterium]